MHSVPLTLAALLGGVSLSVAASAHATDGSSGHYVTARVISAEHRADNMDASARPGIGRFVPGREKHDFITGAVGVGYAWGNQWRSEGEYTLRRTDTYTSGSSAFPTSFNHHHVQSQRLMANLYRDVALNDAWALYASAGLGVARLKSSGWQGNDSRPYIAATRTSLAWSLGAGVSFAASDAVLLELGYRYVDMGTTESGWNDFGNARGLQDEKMSLDLRSSEVLLGMRYRF